MKGVSGMSLSEYELKLRAESMEYGREEGRREGRNEMLELFLKIRELSSLGYSKEEISRKLNLPDKYLVII